MEKRAEGSNIICPVISRLRGRSFSGEEGKGTEILGKKIKISKNGDGEEYQIAGNFIHPCFNFKNTHFFNVTDPNASY